MGRPIKKGVRKGEITTHEQCLDFYCKLTTWLENLILLRKDDPADISRMYWPILIYWNSGCNQLQRELNACLIQSRVRFLGPSHYQGTWERFLAAKKQMSPLLLSFWWILKHFTVCRDYIEVIRTFSIYKDNNFKFFDLSQSNRYKIYHNLMAYIKSILCRLYSPLSTTTKEADGAVSEQSSHPCLKCIWGYITREHKSSVQRM